MARFRKKPLVIEATQWFLNGDHPEDGTEVFEEGEFKGLPLEGKVVRYYRRPDVDGARKCEHCGGRMHQHGWIDTLEGGHTVCPGDWIITGVKGERYPCKPDIFEATYDAVEEKNSGLSPCSCGRGDEHLPSAHETTAEDVKEE